MIRESTADIIRRKRGVMQMPEMDLTGASLTEDDINSVGEPSPEDVAQVEDVIAEHEQPRPSSVPALVAGAVTGAVPPDLDASEMKAAREADRQSHNNSVIELAGKQFVAGLTKTPQAQMTPRGPSQVGQAQEAAKTRAARAAEVLRNRRQGDVDAESLRRFEVSRGDKAAATDRATGAKAAADAESLRRFEVTDARQKETNAATQAIASAGLGIRGSAEKRDAEKFEADKAKAAKGERLTDATITDLADTDTALRSLDDLGKKFVDLGQEGMIAKASGKLSGALGLTNTDAGQYLSAAKLSMQGVGKIMEGGKLAAGDETKYMGMLPVPGDSFESAAIKIKAAQKYLRGLRDDRVRALKAAGRDVPSFGGQPTIKRVRDAKGRTGKWDGVSPLPPGVEVIDG